MVASPDLIVPLRRRELVTQAPSRSAWPWP